MKKQRWSWFVAIVLMMSVPLVAAAEDGEIIGREPYSFPPFAKAAESTDVVKYATEEEYAAAVRDERFVLEKIRYRSDGLSVVAYLYRPRVASAPLPCVVFNRGSFVRGDIAPELVPMFHRLASGGFVILAPLYRQSDGGEGTDEMGGNDLHDLMNVSHLVRHIPSADAKNLFLYGESRGGMMVFQAIRDAFPARAAATFGGFTDLEPIVSTPQGLGMANQIWKNFEQRRGEIVATRSAIRFADKLTTPLLLMHGGGDRSISPAQTLTLALQLQEKGLVYGVFVFPGDNHLLQANAIERDRRAMEWFRRHLAK